MKTILVLSSFLLGIFVHADLPGLVAQYDFQGNADDSSGNARNGAVFGAQLTSDRFGNPNSAYAFQKVGDYIVVQDSMHPQGEVTLTYSCWVKIEGNLDAQLLNVASAPPGAKFTPNSRSDFSAVSNRLGYIGEGNDFGLNTPLSAHVWHLVALTKASTNLTFYVDGKLVGTGRTRSGQNVTSHTLFIGDNGNRYHNNYEQFIGALDDVKIFNRALSPDEVQQLYQSEIGPRVIFIKAFTVDLANLSIGSTYQLQASTDGVSWGDFAAPFVATSATVTNTSYWRVSDWQKVFFRLR